MTDAQPPSPPPAARLWLWAVCGAAAAAAALFAYRFAENGLARLIAAGRSQTSTAPIASEGPTSAAPTAPAAETVVSGLDLIRGSGRAGPAPSTATLAAQAQVLQQAGLGMIDSVLPLLSDPRLSRAMTPGQLAQVRQLAAFARQAEAAQRSGRPISAQDALFWNRRAQELVRSVLPPQPDERTAK